MPPLSRSGTSKTSIRVFEKGTTSFLYSANQYFFRDYADLKCGPRDTFPLSSIRVWNDGADPIFVSFDGVHDHAEIKPGGVGEWKDRVESAIALRSTAPNKSSSFRLEAW